MATAACVRLRAIRARSEAFWGVLFCPSRGIPIAPEQRGLTPLIAPHGDLSV